MRSPSADSARALTFNDTPGLKLARHLLVAASKTLIVGSVPCTFSERNHPSVRQVNNSASYLKSLHLDAKLRIIHTLLLCSCVPVPQEVSAAGATSVSEAPNAEACMLTFSATAMKPCFRSAAIAWMPYP